MFIILLGILCLFVSLSYSKITHHPLNAENIAPGVDFVVLPKIMLVNTKYKQLQYPMKIYYRLII